MAFEIRKAQRRKARLRLGMMGASGSGKTLSSLLIAYGLVGDWSRIGLIDTEQGSGELYVGTEIGGTTIGDYLYGRITPPFEVRKYLEGIKALESAGAQVIIIDSLSHAWSGEGGMLEKVDKIAARHKNNFVAWREVTPEHNALVDAMLQSPSHIIACCRTKTEYTLEEDGKGKKVPKKIGMAPVQRDGLEYEFTVVLDLDEKHTASASKDRTNLFDGRYFTPTPEHGGHLRAWLETGTDAPPPAPASDPPRAGSADSDAPPPPFDRDAAVQQINAARSLQALKAAFTRVWTAAKQAGDTDAMETLEALKDARKAELQDEGESRQVDEPEGGQAQPAAAGSEAI